MQSSTDWLRYILNCVIESWKVKLSKYNCKAKEIRKVKCAICSSSSYLKSLMWHHRYYIWRLIYVDTDTSKPFNIRFTILWMKGVNLNAHTVMHTAYQNSRILKNKSLRQAKLLLKCEWHENFYCLIWKSCKSQKDCRLPFLNIVSSSRVIMV